MSEPTMASRTLQSEKPFRPLPVRRLPKNPPRNAPTMPMRIVTMIPPGSFPGMIALAIAPAIKPRTIHAIIPITIASEKGGLRRSVISQRVYQTGLTTTAVEWGRRWGMGVGRWEAGVRRPSPTAHRPPPIALRRPLTAASEASRILAFADARRRRRRQDLRRADRAPAHGLCQTSNEPRRRRARMPDDRRADAARRAPHDATGHRRRPPDAFIASRLAVGGVVRRVARRGVRLSVWRDDPHGPPRPARHARPPARHLRARPAAARGVLRPEPGWTSRDTRDVRCGISQ